MPSRPAIWPTPTAAILPRRTKYYLELGNTEESFEALVQHLHVFTDFGLMARVMGDPEKSAKLMAVLADPDVAHLMHAWHTGAGYVGCLGQTVDQPTGLY